MTAGEGSPETGWRWKGGWQLLQQWKRERMGNGEFLAFFSSFSLYVFAPLPDTVCLPFASDSPSTGGNNPVMAVGRDINIPFFVPSVCRSPSSATRYWHENRGRELGLDKMLQRKAVSATEQQRLLIWDLQRQEK